MFIKVWLKVTHKSNWENSHDSFYQTTQKDQVQGDLIKVTQRALKITLGIMQVGPSVRQRLLMAVSGHIMKQKDKDWGENITHRKLQSNQIFTALRVIKE